MKTHDALPEDSRRWLVILIVLAFAEVTTSFEVGMMYGALATLMREFNDPVGAGWLITAFLLVGAVSAALCSRLGDLYGRRRLVIVMLVFATTGSLIGAFAPSLPWLIAGRALQGMSAALLPLVHRPRARAFAGESACPWASAGSPRWPASPQAPASWSVAGWWTMPAGAGSSGSRPATRRWRSSPWRCCCRPRRGAPRRVGSTCSVACSSHRLWRCCCGPSRGSRARACKTR